MLLKSSLFLTLAAIATADDDFKREDGVLVLTNDNFADAVAKYKYVLAEFYAPWCGHCKTLAPEYAGAAQALADNEDVALAKIDATVESDLAQKYGVRGYPTLKWFKGDAENALEYGGGRKKDEIVSWINKKTGPPAVELADADAANKAKEDNDVIVVGFFKDADKADFIKAADSFDDLPFFISSADAVAEALEMKDGQVSLFKKFDEGRNDYSEGDIAAFVKENMLAYVTEFSDKTAPKIFGGDIKKHILMFSAKSSSDFDDQLAAFTEVAKSFRGKVLFVHIDCDKSDNGRILEFFGLKEEDCPDSRMIEMGKQMQKFKPENSELTQENINAFVSGVLDGSIKRHLMSEAEPEKNDEPVFILTGSNFEKTVYAEDKSVFVEFYAPWCGHCKSLAPIWDQLGEAFADRDDIVIAKSDATANEFDGVEVSGFPTLKYFPKGERKIVDYSGGRDLESLKKFVETNGGEDAAEEEEDDTEEEVEEAEEPAEEAPAKDEL